MTFDPLATPAQVVWAAQTTKGAEGGVTAIPSLAELPGLLASRTGLSLEHPALWSVLDSVLSAVREAESCKPLEIFLPLLDRAQARDSVRWLPNVQAHRIAPGRMVLAPVPPSMPAHRRGYAEALIALACAGTPDLPGLTFTHYRPFLAAPGGRRATVRLPSASLARWMNAPCEATNQFFFTFSAVSRRVQESLRVWLRSMYFSRPVLFRDLPMARAAMMYWLSGPFPGGGSRTEFTYDAAAPGTLGRICRVPVRRFATELESIRQHLTAAGDLRAAHCYRELHTREIMDAVARERKRILSFARTEEQAMNALLNFAAALRERGVRAAAEAGITLMHELRRAFSAWPVERGGHDLAVLALIEATAAVCVHQGEQDPIDTSISFEDAPSGDRENFCPDPALAS